MSILYTYVHEHAYTDEHFYTYDLFPAEYSEVPISNGAHVALQVPKVNNIIDRELPTTLGTLGIDAEGPGDW